MKLGKRILSALLALCMVLMCVPLNAHAGTVASGKCGNNLTWVLDDSGKLTISGTGPMANYEAQGSPLYDYRLEITSVVIGKNITTIGDWMFHNCDGLTSVVIPDSVTAIGEGAFFHCGGLRNITIGNGVTTIGYKAFYSCDSLTNVIIPDNVTTIGGSAFWACFGLSSVTIGNGVTTIGDEAFKDCRKLSSVTIGNNVTTIGSHAFYTCTSLRSVRIPASVTSLAWNAFSDCTNLAEIHVDINNPNYSSCDQCVLFNKEKTKLIRASAAITGSYTIPSSVTSIGDNAFSGCTNLTGITIPGSVTSIGDSAFHSCENLTGITIPDGVTTIGDHTFHLCRKLSKVDIPDSVTSIGQYAFAKSESLTDVYYCGTGEQWSQIDIATANDYLTGASIHYGHNYIEGICSRCGQKEKFVLANDVWSFENTYDDYGAASEGYYITDADMRRLIGDLPRTVTESLLFSEVEVELAGKPTTVEQSTFNIENRYSDIQCLSWGGSCYGMSTWVCLNSYGVRKASDIDGSTRTLNGHRLTPAVESAINYYQYQQRLSPVALAIEAYKGLSQVEQLKILQDLGQKANETGEAFLIWYSSYSRFNSDGTCDTTSRASHAVVGYGLENIEPITLSVLDTTYTYTHRILVYDSNDPKQTHGDWNIYYNDAGIWCIPGLSGHEKISADSVAANGRRDNANLVLATADISVLNGVDYVTGGSNVKSKIATIETAHNAGYTLVWGDNVAEISGFTVSSEVENHGLTVVLDCNTITAEGTVPGMTRVILPEADEYTVESADDAMSFRFQNDNYFMSCVADASGNISFAQDGTVSFLLDEPGDYYLNLVANEGSYSLPWYKVEIEGENAERISTENTDDGIVVNSDNLESVTITVTSDEGTTEIFGHTGNDAILIAQDAGKPVIYEDKDGDGHYEKDITKEENTGCDDSTTDTDHLCDECGKQLSECTDTDKDYVCDTCGAELKKPAEPTDPSEPEETKPEETIPEETKPQVPECPKDGSCILSQFDDIKVDDWYHDGIHFCVEKEIMNGMGDGKFAPNEPTTRAQLVTMLYRLAGKPSVAGKTEPFNDVAEDGWYYEAILWAFDTKVVNGISETEFAPDANVTREQVATILYRYLGEPEGTGKLEEFPDVADVSAYAVAPLTWAVGEKLITGIAQADGTALLAPTGNATRAQIATILMRHLTA